MAAGPHPRRELTLSLALPPPAGRRRCSALQPPCLSRPSCPSGLPMLLPERFDLHVDTSRQIELHQRVHCLRRRLEDVDEPLVRADFELLARLLVHVRRTQHGPLVLRRRQRNRARQPSAGTLGGIDDFGRRLIEHPVVVRLEANSNLVAERCCCHGYLPCMRATTSSLTFGGACSYRSKCIEYVARPCVRERRS